MIAAVNGYSPAGGCVMAMTCDYRIMAEGEKFVIGLNEVAVGITVPEYIFLLFKFWVGSRRAYHNLIRATLFSVKGAVEVGLVDESCPMEGLLERAEDELQRILMASDRLIVNSKKNLRAGLIQSIESSDKPPMEEKLKAWFDPASRAAMKMIVDRLSK